MKKKLCLASSELPVHPQYQQIMRDDTWRVVDSLFNHPAVLGMNAQTLMGEVPDGSLEHLYASHLLEHIPHPELYAVLTVWKDKLAPGGEFTLNVSDLAWVAKQILKFENGQILTGVYCDFEGDNGLQSLVYGAYTHDSEKRQSGFTRRSLFEWLEGMGFHDIHIDEYEDEQQVGGLLATCKK